MKRILLVLLASLVFFALGYYITQLDENRESFRTNLNMEISGDSIIWETSPMVDSLKYAYLLKLSEFNLSADNALSFKLYIPKAPLVMESIFGSQLDRKLFQIPFQTFSESGTVIFEGIDMKMVNPFHPIDLLFIYEYGDGVRARQFVQFTID